MSRRRETPPRPFLVYAAAHTLLGATALAVTLLLSRSEPDYQLALIAAAIVLSEMGAVDLPGGGSASISYPLLVAATVLYGPAGGAPLVLLASLDFRDIRGMFRRGTLAVTGNAGQLVTSYVVAGWAYAFMTGGPHAWVNPPVGTGVAPPLVLGALSGFAALFVSLNTVFTVVGIALMRRESFKRVWRASISWALATHVLLGFLGYPIALILVATPAGFPLFIFPLLIARQLYQRYVKLKDAYLDTVRSLIAAIETKDAYTRGHSERVAGLAVRVGGILGLGEDTLGRLEFAALLHDLGKIGIRASVLAKRGQLTSSEFDDIRKHPEIGARILERVPYLEEVVPAVVAHHERFDGAGYCAGLSGERIPMEARILAVADAYDAMTTERPYRGARSHETAIEELRHGAGRQFDPAVVGAFLALHDALPLEDAAGSVTVSGEAVSPDA